MKTKKKPLEKTATETELADDKIEAGLHLLYVKWACKHLVVIDKMIRELGDLSNIHMSEVAEVLFKERNRLVKTNPAYKDANEILVSLKPFGLQEVYDEEAQ